MFDKHQNAVKAINVIQIQVYFLFFLNYKHKKIKVIFN
jgi:hypothetical protein